MRAVNVLRLLVLAALPLTLGCSSDNKGKIEGTKWSSMAANLKGTAVPDGALQLEFRSDGSLVYKAGPQTYTGTYSLGMGNQVTLNLNEELAGRKKHMEKVTISGDMLTMADSDGTSVTFQRSK